MEDLINDYTPDEKLTATADHSSNSSDSHADERTRTQSNWERVKRALKTPDKYKRRVKKIDGDADRIEKAIQDMLNLKRTRSSIKDAHSSLILSTAVIGFTVVTIVFAPLAFLTALFALKIQGFGRLQVVCEDDLYDSSKISGIFSEWRPTKSSWRMIVLTSRSRR